MTDPLTPAFPTRMHCPTPLARRGAAMMFVAFALLPFSLGAQEKQTIRPLAYSKLVLRNGLVLVLNEDHSAPIVGLEVLYHIGSKDESSGQTGWAHLCEHLMGEGSLHAPTSFSEFVQSIGGTAPASSGGASTDYDRTHYFFTLPTNQLETALWYMSDRMAAPLVSVGAERLRPIREIVRQERRSRRENPPFGEADAITIDQFYVGQERYPRDPLAPMADIDAAELSGIKQFCGPYYVPNNAVLALSGDFTRAAAETLVKKYFGGIPRGVVPPHPVIAPTPFTSERRLVLEDARAKVPQLRMTWNTAGFADADQPALNALAAILAPADPRAQQSLPGADRAGRLSKLLVYDRQLAVSVTAGNQDSDRHGFFQIIINPRGDASLGQIETLVDSVLADLKVNVVADSELTPYRKAITVINTTSLQTRVARADTLAQSEAFAGDPVAYAKQMERLQRITPTDLRAIVRKYLTNQRVVVSLVPAGKLDLVSKPSLPFTNVTPKPRVQVP